MIRQVLFSAVLAGLLAGLLTSALQAVTTTPLILHAETFEAGEAPTAHDHGAAPAAGHSHGEDAWAPGDGIELTLAPP